MSGATIKNLCFLNRRAGATVKGGGYFFVPGNKARHYLATLGG